MSVKYHGKNLFSCAINIPQLSAITALESSLKKCHFSGSPLKRGLRISQSQIRRSNQLRCAKTKQINTDCGILCYELLQ
jgi:hypothetical protein